MLKEELLALRQREQDLHGQRALAKGCTKSWKERSRSVSSSDVLGDIERSFFQRVRLQPATSTPNSKLPRQHHSSSHDSIPTVQGRRHAAAASLHLASRPADSADRASDSTLQAAHRSPSTAAPLQQNSPSSFRHSPRSRDSPLLDPTNPAAFFLTSSSRREGGPRTGGGATLGPSSGSGRQDRLSVSSPRRNGMSPLSPRTAFPHSASVPSTTPTASSKSRFVNSLAAEAASLLTPSHSSSEASGTVMVQMDTSAAASTPVLGLPGADSSWQVHGAFTNARDVPPRTRSTGSLGRMAGLEMLRQLQAGESESGTCTAGNMNGERKAKEKSNARLSRKHTDSWNNNAKDPANQLEAILSIDKLSDELKSSDIPTWPVSPILPLQSPRGIPGGPGSSSRRGMERLGSLQQVDTPHPLAVGSFGGAGHSPNDAAVLLQRGAGPGPSTLSSAQLGIQKAPQRSPGPPTPASEEASSLNSHMQSRSPATVPDASLSPLSRQMVRRCSYGGMDWWRDEQEQMGQGVAAQGDEELHGVGLEMSMTDYLGLLEPQCSVKMDLSAMECMQRSTPYGAPGLHVPRRVFEDNPSSLSANCSPVRGRARYPRSNSIASRISLEIDLSQILNVSAGPQDTEVTVRTPRMMPMQNCAAHGSSTQALPSAGTPTRPSTGTRSSTPGSHTNDSCSPKAQRSGSRRASTCASPLGRQSSPAAMISEDLLLRGGGESIAQDSRHQVPAPMRGGDTPHLQTNNAEQQPMFVRSGPKAVSKTMSWNEGRALRQEREMPPTSEDADQLSNPFTWKELEESCRKLDQANIRIAGIDLTDVASNEGDDDVEHTCADTADSGAEVAETGGNAGDVMLLSPATMATQKCGMPWELPLKSQSAVSSPPSNSVNSSKPGSPVESLPRKVLFNRVLGKVKKQWESLHGSSRFLSRHGSAHM